jgi:5-methyltetrahydropteroyltriglutamate--homocysteine methyltransferase
VTIPTEPIGSVPRPAYLLEGLRQFAAGEIDAARLDELVDTAVVDTISRFEATGSPVISDGEQGKPSFATYPLAGSEVLAPDGVVIPFADGHARRLPVLTAGPFSYQTYAAKYLLNARKHTNLPIKQAVIAASAISLIYPPAGLEGYSKEEFVEDLVAEAEADIRSCLDAGSDSVQVDFTEGRLSLKLDPSGGLLRSFIDLNNAVFARFSDAERRKIGVHTCPGGDMDSAHSLDIDYGDLLPALFELRVGSFYVQLASEQQPREVLQTIKDQLRPDQRVFIGVIDPINPRIETADEVKARVLQAAEFLPVERLGTCDDCGFSPFADDTSTSRDIAFAKIASRVEGTRLAGKELC